VNAVAELKKLKKPKVFKGMNEVAVKIEQLPDDIGHAPEHEPFTDERKNVRIEKCALCGAEYFLAFSPIYRTRKTFEELSDELQTRLKEDHRMNRNHGPLVPLRRSDRTRKRNSRLNGSAQHSLEVYSQESENLRSFSGVDLNAVLLCPVPIAHSRQEIRSPAAVQFLDVHH